MVSQLKEKTAKQQSQEATKLLEEKNISTNEEWENLARTLSNNHATKAQAKSLEKRIKSKSANNNIERKIQRTAVKIANLGIKKIMAI